MSQFISVSDIEIFVKVCHKCNVYYRYQEFSDGVINVDDKHLLSLDLCIFLRSGIKVELATDFSFNSSFSRVFR